MTQELMWEAACVIWEARKRAAWGKGADLMIGRAPWQSHASHPECHEDHLLALAEIKALVKRFDLSRPALSPPAEVPFAAEDACLACNSSAPVDWERVGPKLVEALKRIASDLDEESYPRKNCMERRLGDIARSALAAGAQGEAVDVDRDWMIKVIRERSLPQDAADMIIGAMRFAATPAQPDTGSHGYGWNTDMSRLPAALTLIFRDPVDKDGCEMVRFGLSTDAMNATAWSYLPGVAQPDTGDEFCGVGWVFDDDDGHEYSLDHPDARGSTVENLLRSTPQEDHLYALWQSAITQPDTGDVAALREALKWLEWARPKAVSAMEDHRALRVKCGHDMTGTYRSGTTYVGLYQSEVDEIEESADFIANLRKRLAALSKPNAPGSPSDGGA